MQVMAEEYKNKDDAGGCFVHLRKKRSSNRGLRALREIARDGKLYSVKLKGNEAESILTNSAYLAKVIDDAECDSSQAVEQIIEEEVKGKNGRKRKFGLNSICRMRIV